MHTKRVLMMHPHPRALGDRTQHNWVWGCILREYRANHAGFLNKWCVLIRLSLYKGVCAHAAAAVQCSRPPQTPPEPPHPHQIHEQRKNKRLHLFPPKTEAQSDSGRTLSSPLSAAGEGVSEPSPVAADLRRWVGLPPPLLLGGWSRLRSQRKAKAVRRGFRLGPSK